METQKQGLTCRRRLCMMLAEEKMNQTLIERYIGLRLLRTFLVVTLVFTLVVWLIQTLNLIDNIGGKGTTIIGFLGISLLGIPSLLSYILPPALLIAVLTQMIRLLQDHEYFALSAAGFSPRRLLQPILLIVGFLVVIQLLLSFLIAPTATHFLRQQKNAVSKNFVTDAFAPGSFQDIAPGITAFADSLSETGELQQVLIYDYSDISRPVTYTAREGRITRTGPKTFFLLSDGHIHDDNDAQDNRGLIVFSEYILPLNADAQESSTILMRPRDTTIFQILNPPAVALQQKDFLPRMYKSARERVANITTLLVFAFLGFVVATTAGMQRTGYGRQVLIASSFAIIYQIGIFALSGDGTKNGLSIIYLGLWFCLYAGVCVWLIFAP
ncbi:MAG: LptF/LptG family permease, partial [Pseudomonadota bacterium]|nr:LptF/LptG family permease [Pseudomonadota bacterium]